MRGGLHPYDVCQIGSRMARVKGEREVKIQYKSMTYIEYRYV